MTQDSLLLSKTLSHALRHQPWLYELELDDEGWTDLAAVLDAMSRQQEAWRNLSEADLVEMIACSDKPRFEIDAGRIRALYGHSLPGKLRRTPATPPAALYHGTSSVAAKRILEEGLLPMRRQYVHLSIDVGTAMAVGNRKCSEPVVLRVKAGQAASEGIVFYEGNDRVWLADTVPAKYIEAVEGATAE